MRSESETETETLGSANVELLRDLYCEKQFRPDEVVRFMKPRGASSDSVLREITRLAKHMSEKRWTLSPPLTQDERRRILRPYVMSLHALGYTAEQIHEFARTQLDPRPTLAEVRAIIDNTNTAEPDAHWTQVYDR